MKRKLYQSLLLAIVFTFAGNAYADNRNIHVDVAGTLPTIISDAEKYTIEELTLTGNLNGTDFRLLREMAGNDYLGQPTNGSLKKLDLSGAYIVEGGEKYLDTDRITSSTSTYTQNVGENSFHYETENNVLGKSLFAGCDKLEEVILPNSLTTIGEYQFWYCLNLKSISIGKNVSSIGWELVYGPNKLTNISVDEGNVTFSSPANSNLLMQGTKVFLGFGNPTFPAETTVIGSEAFSSCSSLGDITIPEGVTTIEVGAFAWSSLKSISFPSTLTTICNDAFAGCYNLTSFTLPKAVTHYGEGLGALKDCGNLTSISVEKGNPVYDSRDNCNAIIETNTNTLISGCKNTVIPTSVTILGHQPFRGVTLSNYVIPNWIMTIGEMAFWNANMTSVTIPSSVTYIGEYAFAYPISLTTVTVESVAPVIISENTFTDRSNIDLIVPVGSIAAYKSANYWKEFKTIKDVNGNTEDDSSTLDKIIDVARAGTLSQLISNDEKFTITELTLTGELNGTDFRLLREMAGNNWEGNPTNGKLVKIDLSGAKIVAGGENYVNTKSISGASGNTTTNGDGFIYTTENDVFGPCLFAGCENLQVIKLPSSIKAIGNSAFHFDWNLKELIFPKSLVQINDINYGCSGLSFLSVEEGNPVFSSPAGSNAILQGSRLVLGCNGTIIPTNVTTIGNSAFVSCGNSGQTFTIPEGVTTIETWNFVDCHYDKVVLPEGLTTIGDYFASWSTLKELTIPSTVRKIGEYSMNSSINGCWNLTKVTSNIVDPTAVVFGTQDVFTNIPESAVLYVPASSIGAYKSTSPWNNFKNIEPINTLGKCATPEISYANGKLTFTCETDDVEFISDVTSTDIKKYSSNEVELTGVYKVSVYATKPGYDKSDVTTREIVITGDGKDIVVGDVDGDGKVNVADHVKLSAIIMGK